MDLKMRFHIDLLFKVLLFAVFVALSVLWVHFAMLRISEPNLESNPVRQGQQHTLPE